MVSPVASLLAVAFLFAGCASASYCDGLADGVYCENSVTLTRCFNGDILWFPTICDTACVPTPTGAKCETTPFCDAQQVGAYCVEDTKTSCRVDGRQVDTQCQDGCRTALTVESWAYCYVPPVCEYTTAPDSAFQFCEKPDYQIPVDSSANATDSDGDAEELFTNLAALAPHCEFIAREAACNVAFPDCPLRERCRDRCELYNSCGTYHNATTFIPVSCGNLCETDGAASMVVPLLFVSCLVLLSLLL